MIKIVGDDMWDPNNWVQDDHEFRIYADETLEIYAVVDEIDYQYLVQYRWSVHKNIRHNYLRRGVAENYAPSNGLCVSPITGKLVRNRNRIQRTEFLHQAVMRRTGIEPPSPSHREVDHRDRNELNCRRTNLQWATRRMQVRNSGKCILDPARSYRKSEKDNDISPLSLATPRMINPADPAESVQLIDFATGNP